MNPEKIQLGLGNPEATALLVERIDALLPQTQCQRCSYPACRPYAEAIAAGDAEINQCPPGGPGTIEAIAALLKREPLALNPNYGTHRPTLPRAAIIENDCIGCTKCIQACPVDAIHGAAKHMHTVIAAECTGCELCLPPCPVDCIELLPTGDAWDIERAAGARTRYQARTARLARNNINRDKQPGARQSRAETAGNDVRTPAHPSAMTLEQKQQTIAAAVARVRAKRNRKS